jgi:hypothetical protein
VGKHRTDLKPSDFIRCFRCNRLVQKTTAWRIFGVSYGPECALKAIRTVEESQRLDQSAQSRSNN